MSPDREHLHYTADVAADFLGTLDTRPMPPRDGYRDAVAAFAGPVPGGPTDPRTTVEELAAAAEPGLIGMPSGRFYGFVIGGSLPAALASDWLVTA